MSDIYSSPKVTEKRRKRQFLTEVNYDISIAQELANRPKSLAENSRFGKLQFAIRFREAGKFPISDERFENDIQELVSILALVK